MSQARSRVVAKGDFINGRFEAPRDPSGEWVNRSPADQSDEVARVRYSYQAIDESVQAARQALASWKRLPLSARADCLKSYKEAVGKRKNVLAELIAREIGKPLWEAEAEVDLMIAQVDVTLSESMRFVADIELSDNDGSAGDESRGVCRFRSLGVVAVVGSFSAPGYLPNGHLVPALLTGNTVVFKPSEKSPLVGQVMAECFEEARIPAGAINLVQGEEEIGRRLCVHEGVDGIFFTGSYEVGTRIKQDTLQQHWKLLALEMGGKNPVLVWEDADLDVAVLETLVGAFVTAGQRCTSTSRAIVHKRVFKPFLEKLHARAKAFSIGHPLENPFMGPLIDQSSMDRYMKFLGIAAREGSELVMRGKALELEHEGNYVAPSICWVKNSSVDAVRKSIYQQTELLAPNVAVMEAEDLSEAIALANATQYGLIASVFSKEKSIYDKCFEELQFGWINWNKSTIEVSPRLPLGGLKKSGNHFPTGILATRYCTFPVSSLEVSHPRLADRSSFQGLNWE